MKKGRILVLFTLAAGLVAHAAINSAKAGVHQAQSDPPFAAFLTPDSAWCRQSSNLTTADILISGTGPGSSFELVVDFRGVRDTLEYSSDGIKVVFLNNQVGRNEYYLRKIIEFPEGGGMLEQELNDLLVMQVWAQPKADIFPDYDDLCNPAGVMLRTEAGFDTYTWYFGDGEVQSSNQNEIMHTYTLDDELLPQVFEVGLRIENDFGCWDSGGTTLNIFPAPVSQFQVDPELLSYPETTVTLSNTSSPGSWNYQWNFGDGSGSSQRDPGTHIYDTWGTYTITLRTYSDECEDLASRQVQILPPPPQAAFSPDTFGCPPLEIRFRNESLYAQSYEWDFGDGTSSTEENPTHIFTQSKIHTVNLKVTGLSGTDETSGEVLVDQTPIVDFAATPIELSIIEEVEFSNLSINSARILWDFGDGITSEEEIVTHQYETPGVYTVSLFAWSTYDCPDTLIREDLITVKLANDTTRFPKYFRWNGNGPTGGFWNPGPMDHTIFRPYVQNAEALRIIILTRLGHKVFESNELYRGWDGYLPSGDLAPQGVYIYRAWITYTGGREEFITGDLTFLH